MRSQEGRELLYIYMYVYILFTVHCVFKMMLNKNIYILKFFY